MSKLSNRIRGMFASSRSTAAMEGLAPDPEWDELLSWAVGLPAGDSAAQVARTGEDADGDASEEWEWAVARAKALTLAAAAAPVAAGHSAPVASAEKPSEAPAAETTTWADGLAQARARRLAEDAEWAACLERAKESREREAAARSEDEDAEWLACLQRAKAASRSVERDASDEDAEWQACLQRAKAGDAQHAG